MILVPTQFDVYGINLGLPAFTNAATLLLKKENGV